MADPNTFAGLEEQFGDIFGQLGGLFQGTGQRARASRDLRTSLRVSFAEAADGGAREVEIERWLGCVSCAGTGAAEGAEWETCDACDGVGQKHVEHGAFQLKTTCEACLGKGRSAEDACEACSGKGGATQLDKVTVQIPGGVGDGQELRLAGKGSDFGDGQGPGDHFLQISVGTHPQLARRGDDLYANVELDTTLATEGGEVQVPIPRGYVTVRVRPGTKTGDTARLAGHGVQKLAEPRTPRPTGVLEPFRSLDPSAHRGELVVVFVQKGDPLPEASHRAVLGVADDASPAEIKAAYRKLALANHPDRNPGDQAAKLRFDQAADAHAALSKSASPLVNDQPTDGMASRMPFGLVIAVGVMAAMIMYAILTR